MGTGVRKCGQLMLLAGGLLSSTLQQSSPAGTAPFHGRLYRVVSSWTPGETMRPDDAGRVPASMRPRFERFTRCYATFKSRLPDTESFPAVASLIHKRALERALTCVVDRPDTAASAADYVTQARILYEWEGQSSAPLEEADDAERYIRTHSDSPFVPYLNLFVAASVRYAFEMFEGEKDPAGMAAAADRYRRFIARAREADPLVRLIADDLDGLPYVYRDIRKHPRDYR